ncbi:RND efflux system, inner membrane transporter [hydrothermal vent metagenome]|uniref:RND efflux system, inner membrane transporter n=1 Tax=hydrothermal vent metagenome TaxID=652676 RepID=A0A3B0YYN8_9ZZZZ
MNFTDIFIKRPVLATVVSLLILIIGLRSLGSLEVRQYPEMKNTVISITTVYPGADSELVKGFVTTPLQQAIAEAEGIDYISSTSTQGLSLIQVHMKLNYDPNAAVSEIQAKIASKRNILPVNAEDPLIESTTGDSTALMYLAFYSKKIDRSKITDYVLRVIQPKLQALPGVAKARIIGQPFAMRIWLNPKRMAALKITANEITQVLRRNNYLAGIGATKGKYVTINLTASTHLSSPKDFQNLIIRKTANSLIRLRDVAKTTLGAEDYKSTAWYKGIPAVFIGIEPAPGANPLTVATLINNEIPKIRSQLPNNMLVKVPYDASKFIADSITEVYWTLIESVLIVIIVVFLTLGSIRAAFVPAIAVPLSLIGATFIILLLGYSLNLLTLLAMVLAIGLVVDDAIIVVENIHRQIEEGESRTNAALIGARELTLPIIAMTTTLLAVYAPIGFMGGLVGTLFTEFAFTLAAAVLISGIVALTLSPMLSTRVLKSSGQQGKFEQWVEQRFKSLSSAYRRTLTSGLKTKSIFIVIGLVVLSSNYFMFNLSKKELAPTEDQSILFFAATTPQTATLDYHKAYAKQVQTIFETFPEYYESFFLLGRATDLTFGGFKMKPAWERLKVKQRTQQQVQLPLMGRLQTVAGFKMVTFARPSIPGSGGGLPVQFVLTSDQSFDFLHHSAKQLIGAVMKSGQFLFLKTSLSMDKPLVKVMINRDRAGDLGISMQEIGRNLSRMLGGGYVNFFSMQGRSYKVIPQVERSQRMDNRVLKKYYIKAANGSLIALSNIIHFKHYVEPSKRTQMQQLNSITIEGLPMPGTGLGTALEYLEKEAKKLLPKNISYDFSGQSRQYTQQGSSLLLTFFLSMVIIYLVLAAQFESWRDPIIILVTVPLATAGALAFIMLGVSSINIYTQVGLITLIGVITKNGILIVEFANKLQIEKGMSKHNAIIEAATLRLRPIIMTSVSLIVAMIPLLIANGPGAESRFAIGMTIAAGLGVGTLFTLYVLPAFYLVIGKDHSTSIG